MFEGNPTFVFNFICYLFCSCWSCLTVSCGAFINYELLLIKNPLPLINCLHVQLLSDSSFIKLRLIDLFYIIPILLHESPTVKAGLVCTRVRLFVYLSICLCVSHFIFRTIMQISLSKIYETFIIDSSLSFSVKKNYFLFQNSGILPVKKPVFHFSHKISEKLWAIVTKLWSMVHDRRG